MLIKTFCKPANTNICDPEFIYWAVYDCVKHKLYRNDFLDLLCVQTGIPRDIVIKERSQLNKPTPMIDGAIKKLSEKCAQMISNNKLKFKKMYI